MGAGQGGGPHEDRAVRACLGQGSFRRVCPGRPPPPEHGAHSGSSRLAAGVSSLDGAPGHSAQESLPQARGAVSPGEGRVPGRCALLPCRGEASAQEKLWGAEVGKSWHLQSWGRLPRVGGVYAASPSWRGGFWTMGGGGREPQASFPKSMNATRRAPLLFGRGSSQRAPQKPGGPQNVGLAHSCWAVAAWTSQDRGQERQGTGGSLPMA